jgi:hypothetical protein
MAIQPGVGYTFTSSSQGTNFTIQTPWQLWNYGQDEQFQQFQCVVIKQKVGEVTKHYLKTYKGVVNYTWSQFPFYPSDEGSGTGTAFRSYEKQARITDWAVYANGTRTAGTATSGPDFEWMASNGKLELPAGASGKSVVVTISKIDWWDRDGWLSTYRTIDAEKPFIAVFDSADTNINSILSQQGCSLWSPNTIHYNTTDGLTFTGPVPAIIGYTFKKIAQLDWNDTTNSWDVTQYLVGPIDLPINHSLGTVADTLVATSPTAYENALADEFDSCLNYAWFEGMWAYPGYTMNSSAWWYDIVNT